MSVLEPVVQDDCSYDNLDISIIYFAEYKNRIPSHYSRKNRTNACELLYVREGRLTYYVNGNIKFLNMGDFAFVTENTHRQIYNDETVETNCYFLEFKYKSLDMDSV